MRGNTHGKLFSITSFGESHGSAMGVIVDGMPSKISVSLEDLQTWVSRRAPGRLPGTTARKEQDLVEIMSGVFEGKTLGTPLACSVQNTDQRSKDYDQLKEQYRPGHADKTTLQKYGIRDHRGGGRSSGRETVARVIGGYFAKQILPELKVQASIVKMGDFDFREKAEGFEALGHYAVGTKFESDQNIEQYLLSLKSQGDSVGGVVLLKIENCPPGLGEPCFDKIKADFAKAFLSIGSCVSFSYGARDDFWNLTGKQITEDQSHFSGMEGGMTNGDPISIYLGFRPPSTVGEKAKQGRHDPCILPRALVVVESMAYLVIADHFLRQKAYDV